MSRTIALINHKLYGNITTDQEVINTKLNLLAQHDIEKIKALDLIDTMYFEHRTEIIENFDIERTLILNSKPEVTSYPENEILKIRLVINE